MKNTFLTFVGILILSTFIGCKQNKTYSGSSYKYHKDWKFKVLSQKDNTKSIIIVDKNDNPIKYDDDIDYAEYDIIEYAFYAQSVYSSANSHDWNGKYYFKDYEYVNQNINNVFNLPIKNEIQNKEIKSLFNKVYYDYKGNLIYNKDKGYGYQSFIMSKDGQEHRSNLNGISILVNPTVKLERNEDGNITIILY